MARTSIIERGKYVGIDTSDMKELARAMRQSSRVANREFRTGLRAAGELIAEEAKRQASQYSSTIPATIKVRVSGAGVEIRAGEPGAPLARLFELGNLRSRRGRVARTQFYRGSGSFRHPVWGDRNAWVSQPMHPFLFPAAGTKNKAAQAILTETFTKALRSQGVKVSLL